jgi:hypothetical protein
MIPLRMASIGGFNGPRGSIFQGHVSNSFGQGASMGDASMGQSQGQDLYNEGKRQLALYDNLYSRVQRIANKTVRDDIIRTYGLTEPGNKDKSLYAREVVAGDINKADSYSPPNYYIYEAPGPTRNRPGRLADFNSSFKRDVEQAEITYGILPEPVVIERTTTQTVSEVPTWVMPVTIGAIAVAGLAALGVFSGK